MNPQLLAFFDDITTEAHVRHFTLVGREEDLHLEFKQKVDRRIGVVDEKDRAAFSEALSGFANADGGVLIFGVATRKTPDGPDRADGLKAITDVGRFRTGLMELILQTVQPSVDGVRIETVPSDSDATVGYVKCLIPDSDKPPHRAMHAGREYYRRATNGMRRMEHYELEDTFGRRLRPLLRLGVNFSQAGNPAREGLSFYFLNVGRGVAKHPGFHCTFIDPPGVAFEGVVGLQNATAENAGRPSLCHYQHLGVIHPNGIRAGLGQALFVNKENGAPITLKLIWYAENMLARHALVTFHPGEGAEIEGQSSSPD
jgi:hypothetical protein